MAKKNTSPLEDFEDEALAWSLRRNGLMFTHIPNETPAGSMRNGKWAPNWKTLARNKRVGVQKGFPDYVIFVPFHKAKCDRSILVFLEMKRVRGSTTSPEQKIWIDALSEPRDCEAAVCRGHLDAEKFLSTIIRDFKCSSPP